MLIPKFSLGATERIYLSDKYVSNGHWMLSRAIIKSVVGPKPLKAILDFKTGSYTNGMKYGLTSETMPDMDASIPKRDGHLLLSPSPVSVEFRNEVQIAAYRYNFGVPVKQNPDDTYEDPVQPSICISTDYVPLLMLGFAFAKDPKSPILLLGGKSLNDELLGVIMPMNFVTRTVRS